MRIKLGDLVAEAITDPNAVVGKKLGPSWPRKDAAYSSTEESVTRWSTRAVLTALDNAGALVPTDGRPATFRPGNEHRPTTVTIQLEGPHTIFRFLINMLNFQTEFGAAARAALVDMRDHLGAESFDQMARMFLGEDRHGKMHDRFLRNFDCQVCEQEIKWGRKFYPTDDAGSVCANCCKGHRPYLAKLVTRQRQTFSVPA